MEPISPTSTILPSSPLSHTMTLVSQAHTLLTIPSEIMLEIISFLPTSAYLPLVQTSHGFRLFFFHHAAHICNDRILTHYPEEAALLHSKHIDGWLLPTHPAVATEESLANTKLLISQPGPQYLHFLQSNASQLRIRRSMVEQEFNATPPSPLRPSLIQNNVATLNSLVQRFRPNNTASVPDADPSTDPANANRHAMERKFTFMIGVYLIRPFLKQLHNISLLLDDEFRLASHACPESKTAVSMKKPSLREKFMGIRLGCGMSKGGSEKKLMFGEIERGACEESVWGLKNRVPRDHTWRELGWYHGSSGALYAKERGVGAQVETVEMIEDAGVEAVQFTEKAPDAGPNPKRKVKQGLRKMLRRIVKMGTCFGVRKGFEALE